jgi:predicted AlkP superfamily phosphohydrolase/phosphomutase
MSLHLLRDQPFDLFLTVFPETHWAMHMLWQLLDPEHPAHDPDIVGEFKDFFRELFAKIDARIGELIACRPEANVLVFSLSGMGPNLSCWHLLPEVLQRLQVAAPASARSGGPLGGMLPMRRWGAAKIRKMEDTVSLGAIRIAKRIAPRRLWDRWTRRILHAGNNWNRSRAFCVPNDYSGAIRINLRGREPQGLVEPGAEYDALCTELREALLELEDVETGRPVVKDVLRTREICHGQHVDELPDLIVLWSSERAVGGVRSARVGTVHGTFPERRSGAHRPYGFLIASGPRIRRGVTIEDVHTLDLAPTILSLCGQSVPCDLDGKVLSEMLL